MADLTPNNREEFWLQGMVDGQTTLEPNKRREYWYKEIVDAIGSGGGGGGGGGGALILHADVDTGALDKTWQEIKNSYDAGSVVMLQYGDGSEYVTDYLHKIQSVKGTFSVTFGEFGTLDTFSYVTDNANGYPVYSE